MPGWVGVYLKDGGSFESRSLPGLIAESHYDDDDSAEDSEEFFVIMPGAFVPLGNGIEADLRVFDYIHKDDFAKRYGAANWDIQNVSTDVITSDDGDLQPVTTFSITVFNGSEFNVYDGIGIDSEVLPSTTKFLIGDNQRQALDDHQRAIDSPQNKQESE